MSEKTLVQVWVGDEFRDRLDAARVKHGLSWAELSRRSLVAYLPLLEAHPPIPGPEDIARVISHA